METFEFQNTLNQVVKDLKKTEFMIIFVERNLLLLKVKYEQTLYKLTPL